MTALRFVTANALPLSLIAIALIFLRGLPPIIAAIGAGQ